MLGCRLINLISVYHNVKVISKILSPHTTVRLISWDRPARKKSGSVGRFWLISWDRLERKKSRSVGGIRVEITARLILWNRPER